MSKDKHRARDSSPHTADPPRKRYHTVTQERDGTFVCDCHKFGETGKMCADIVAARLYDEFGHSGDYLKPEQGPEEHGPAAKGKGQPKKSTTGKKGVKLGLPADKAVDDTYDALLQKLEDTPDWNPFGDTESNASDTEQTTTPRIKVSSGRPAAVKPLQKRKSPSKSPTKFSQKRSEPPSSSSELP
ncbi:hypothetical protein B0H14DRAFT_3851295 [Mycena olivaceomarginata]|nr:hypothetical protein B0H14DRAFT_3855402 [Mycena olivaceomarginata]KAJ7903493.1 hypothetical protein B0H14DRAFT_3851295 [Mycena olivaceomarginata]